MAARKAKPKHSPARRARDGPRWLGRWQVAVGAVAGTLILCATLLGWLTPVYRQPMVNEDHEKRIGQLERERADNFAMAKQLAGLEARMDLLLTIVNQRQP